MGDPKGFMKIGKKPAGNRSVQERTGDYSEVEQVLLKLLGSFATKQGELNDEMVSEEKEA